MTILITGASGFIGAHLSKYYVDKGYQVYGVVRRSTNKVAGVKYKRTNLLDQKEVNRFIRTIKPNYIFHLAAQSKIPVSWEKPQETLEINILSTVNLLEALKKTGFNSRIVVFGSSSEYAATDRKIKEDFPLSPGSLYAVSKIAQSNLALLYNRSNNLDSVVVRPFFVFGPDKPDNHVIDFVEKIISVKAKKGEIRVGNIEVVRDYLYIHDAIKAIDLVAKKGKAGEIYNLCSGRGVKVEIVLKKLIKLSGKRIQIQVDTHLMRSIDEPVKVGDNYKLQNLGWSQTISLDESLKNILRYFQNRL